MDLKSKRDIDSLKSKFESKIERQQKMDREENKQDREDLN